MCLAHEVIYAGCGFGVDVFFGEYGGVEEVGGGVIRGVGPVDFEFVG